jgi:hypothetical protein
MNRAALNSRQPTATAPKAPISLGRNPVSLPINPAPADIQDGAAFITLMRAIRFIRKNLVFGAALITFAHQGLQRLMRLQSRTMLGRVSHTAPP